MRRLSALDLIIICVLGAMCIMGLAAVVRSPLIPSFIASLVFCGLIYTYAYLGPARFTRRENDIAEGPVHDISLREQAKLAEGFAEAIIIINHHQRILYANSAAKTLFPDRNVGTTLPNLIQSQQVRTLANETLLGKNSPPAAYTVTSPVERHFRVMGSNIAAEKNKETARRAIIVFYDITDLVRVSTMRADFLANASHELKTPIASLLGYIETLRGHAKDDPEARETFLVIMQQQAERMQRLIADLLSLRRIEIVEHLAPKETADLYLATRAAIEAVEPMAKSRGVKIRFQGPKSAPVIGIQDELIQLVLNLLDNAIKFSPPKSTVNLSLSLLPDWHPGQIFSEDPEFGIAHKRRIAIPSHTGSKFAALRIRDAGPGLSRQHLPRLGERFYKITDQPTNAERGTGLGLAIVKHIVLRHRGGLFVESAQGKGTKFTILIPSSTQR